MPSLRTGALRVLILRLSCNPPISATVPSCPAARAQLFYMIHAIGAPVFLVALFIHDRITAYYVVPAVLLLAVDRVFRTAMDLTNRT